MGLGKMRPKEEMHLMVEDQELMEQYTDERKGDDLTKWKMCWN